MGPSAIRVTGVVEKIRRLGYTVVDRGDVDVPLPEECDIGDLHQRYAEDIADVCEDIRTTVLSAMEAGEMPLVLGGDHSIAMGSVAGVAEYERRHGREIGLLWIDAHGDINTPDSTNSGNVHGMPLSHLLGMGSRQLAGIGGFSPKVSSRRAVLIGVRNLDDREKKLIADSGITVFSMKDIDHYGVSDIMEKAIAIASDGTAGFHVSFDMDAVDPSQAPGVGTPVRGGLNYRESHFLMELISDSGKMLSLDVVELNPILDNHNVTAELAAELMLSAFGKEIV